MMGAGQVPMDQAAMGPLVAQIMSAVAGQAQIAGQPAQASHDLKHSLYEVMSIQPREEAVSECFFLVTVAVTDCLELPGSD